MIGTTWRMLTRPKAMMSAPTSIDSPKARRNTHRLAASSSQLAAAQLAVRMSSWRSLMMSSSRSAIWRTAAPVRSSLRCSLRATQRKARSARPWPSISPSTSRPATNITMMPAMAATPYPLLTPRMGMEAIRPIHRMRLSTTAEPRPAVARANPALGPSTPDRVSSRYPSAGPAALPPGTMFDRALVLIWMRNNRHRDTMWPAGPSAALVRRE